MVTGDVIEDRSNYNILLGMKTDLSQMLKSERPLVLGLMLGAERTGNRLLSFSSTTSQTAQPLRYGQQSLFLSLGAGLNVVPGFDVGASTRITPGGQCGPVDLHRPVGQHAVREHLGKRQAQHPAHPQRQSRLGQPAIPIEHKVRSSLDLTADADPAKGSGSIAVQGEVKFLPDGRMTVQLANKAPVRLTAELTGLGGLLAGALKVRVPQGRFIIDASLAPIKPAQ